MEKTIINSALEFVRNTFNDDYSDHDYFHTLRVYKMAARIAEQENADLMIVQLAALCMMLTTSSYRQKHMQIRTERLAF